MPKHPYQKRFKREQRLIDLLERRALRSLLREIPATKDLDVLDVPTGTGRFLGELKERARLLVGADRSADVLSVVSAGAGSAGGHASRVCCDARSLPFRSASFDLVCVIRLWHHLKTEDLRRSVLREIARVCRSHALITYYRPTRLHAASRRWLNGGKRVQILMLPREHFEREAEEAGFRGVRTVRVLPGLHAQSICLMRRESP